MGGCNRLLHQFQYTYEKDTVTVFGRVTFGAAGAVASIQGGGVKAVTKVSATTGQYEIEFEDQFCQFFMLHTKVVFDTLSAVAAIQIFEDPATIQADVTGDKKIKIACVDDAATAVNPEEDAAIYFQAIFRRTDVGPFD